MVSVKTDHVYCFSTEWNRNWNWNILNKRN